MAPDQILKNPYGRVRPYTRHLASCKHADEPDHNACSCPKWIYEHRKNGQRRRYSLNTPSYAEALRIAADKLRGFDPEIAEARKHNTKQGTSKKTIEEAIALWLDRTRNMFGKDAAIVSQYRSTFGWRDKHGKAHGNFLLSVEAHNLRQPKERIEYIRDVTPLFCQQWHDSWNGRYAEDTRKQRWGTVRSFFAFLHGLGVIDSNPTAQIRAVKASGTFAHVPFTNEQYQKILDEADWYVDDRVRIGEREVYCRRSHLFLELLRHTGMDISDAVMFQATMIRNEQIDRKSVPVLRYHRRKTHVEAVIVMDSKLTRELRKIPFTPDSVQDRPFRYQGNKLSSDSHNWSRRIAKFISLAEIGPVQLVNRDGTPSVDSRGQPITRNPDTKMLRHTFAVAGLLKGLRPEVVAKQLGHVDTSMIFRHYGPWCKERDLAHIREQL